jgi:hypothetical protein
MGTDATELNELNDASPLTTTAQYTYAAFEVFTVPTDLFPRKIWRIQHVDATIRIHSHAPLFCAALSRRVESPFYLGGDTDRLWSGHRCCCDISVPATIGPADDVEADEPP